MMGTYANLLELLPVRLIQSRAFVKSGFLLSPQTFSELHCFVLLIHLSIRRLFARLGYLYYR